MTGRETNPDSERANCTPVVMQYLQMPESMDTRVIVYTL